jgi:pimeloyl-ACP methyl ester carboxylesterase
MSFSRSHSVKIHYQLLGSGDPTVVFLHGLVMDNLSSWFFTMANAVSRSARVLLYDLRGHGFSERPREGYGLELHVDDLEALLEELGITGPVILVGNSFGGLLALSFARRHPARVAGLILVDGQVNDAAWKDQMVRSLRLEGAQRDEAIAKNFQSWQGRNSRRKSSRLAENAMDLVNGTSLVEDLRGSEIVRDDELRAITAPTLAIYGADSDIIATGRKLGALLPNAELKVFDKTTHSVLWEKTEEVKTVILNRITRWQDSCS